MSRRKVTRDGDYTIDTQKELSDQYHVGVRLVGTVTIARAATDPDDLEDGTVTITTSDGTTRVYTFATDAASGNPAQGSGNVINVRLGGDSTASAFAGRLKDAIEHTIGHDGVLSVKKMEGKLTIVERTAFRATNETGGVAAATIAVDSGENVTRANFAASGKITSQVPYVLGEYGFLRLRGG